MTHPLANEIPTSNCFSAPKKLTSGGLSKQPSISSVFYLSTSFVGAFCTNTDSAPIWASKIAHYDRAQFHDNSPHKKTYWGDNNLPQAGEGQAHINFRHTLDLWKAAGKPGVEPFTTSQDYGSCVDASCSEHEAALLGWRATQDRYNEEWKQTPAWYKYANRGYCQDGWSGPGCANVARRVGIAFRVPYTQFGIDFTNDDTNEEIVARRWCRSGIPKEIATHTQAQHPYENGAITEFVEDAKSLRTMFANGGILHTGGTKTSGSPMMFSVGPVGPHMQSFLGCDDSDEFRKHCQDVLKIKPRANDFPVIGSQTWGANWNGEVADRYWPAHWGQKPQGAWVLWASDVISFYRGDSYAWMPWTTGFPRTTPIPPVPVPVPGPTPTPSITVRGTIKITDSTGTSQEFILIPKPQI